MKIVTLLAVISVIALPGCVMGPRDNVGFSSVEHIDALAGVYQNVGESDPSNPPHRKVYLSQVIWPRDPSLDHSAIVTIRIVAVSNTVLQVTALEEHVTRREDTFIEGKDFSIRNGRVHLHYSVEGPGDNVFGVAVEHFEIGLDQKRDGKYRSTGVGAGIVLLIPFVLAAAEDVRFPRISE